MRTILFVAVAAVVLAGAAPAFAEGDAAAGEAMFKRCVACHTVEKGGANKVGPNLAGVVGRKPASVAGFAYSPSYADLAAKGGVWDEPSIFAYLADPLKFMREKTGDAGAKSKMTFALKSEKEREDVIAFLKTK